MLRILTFLLFVPAAALAQSPAAGIWNGMLDVGSAQLPLVFRIEAGAGGTLSATLDSPAQNAFGLPVASATFEAGVLTLSLTQLGASYSGTMNADGTQVDGTWSQGGMSLPLVVTKSDTPAGPNRPQHPEPPYPYREEEVEVYNPDTGVTLSGTLTLPAGEGTFPGVLLVSGSGPQDRDETILGHKPFLVLADHLTRHGIAVLRYDDRGVGTSTGDFAGATTWDFAEDAGAALMHLAAHPAVDANRVGIVGHSEGGLIAPLVAGDQPEVDFVVMLAGPGLRGDDLLMLQTEAISRAAGMDETMLETALALNRGLYDIAMEEDDATRLETRLGAFYDETAAALTDAQREALQLSPDQRTAVLRQLTTPWVRAFLAIEPRLALQRLRIPVLSLIGANDLQVPAEPNTAAIRAAFEETGNGTVDARVLPGLNHLFQTSATGAVEEYGVIEETMAPAVLDAVTDWILGLPR